MKVLILLSVVAVALASRQCGENQHYESCGTACPLTCENYDNPPLVCVLMCNPGCHCDKGYVKTDDGRCVRPEECPARTQQVCGENERYYGCGTACPLTCDNYANPPKICPAMCVIGCQCEQGYVKTRDGRCVRPEECPAPAPVQKTCLDKPETGMCKAYFPMWYYDVTSGKCHKFIYGGCQGNGNRYATEEECLEHCEGIQLRESSANQCELPAETGPCRGFMPRFYFDKASGQCQKFVYGGCLGNENNFKTADECNQVCGAQAAEDVCSLPAEVGLCRGYFPKYYFNKQTGRCQKFIYGGCGGNANNFESVEECEKTCA